MESLVGAGGFGAVYRATDELMGRVVALKVLKSQGAPSTLDDSRDEALATECKAIGRLDHPNVVRVHDAGSFDGYLCIVMEYISGRTLRVACADSRISRTTKHRWLGELAAALAAAHANGVVHCDLKPENALVDEAGHIKVCDFGIAGVAEHPPDDGDEVRRVAGTPRYMCISQRLGDPPHPRFDEYSWAVVVCELLVGAHQPLPALVEALAAEGIPQLLARQINGVLKDGQPPERLDLAWASRVLSASEADRPKPSPGWPTGRTRFALATAGLTVAVACAGALRAAPAANSAAAERSPNGVLGQAQQAWKDGAREEALRILDVHLHENPQDGRAHLLRARIPTWADDAEREHYRQAARTLTELDDVSRALVDALEPAFAVPPDHQSALSRIEEKLKAAPESVDLLVAGSQMAVGAGAMRSAVALTERLLHLQPSFMPARYWHGYALAYENKEREAIAEFRRCIADRPAATTCRWALSELLANAGECNALRELSRDSIELATESPWPYWYAAKSVYEETGNLDALQAAFERLAAFPREGQLIESDDKVSLAVLQGNLAAARSEAERWYNEAATHSESRLGEAARVLGYVLLEQRDQDGLIRLTRDYEKRLAALKSDPRHDSQLLPAILLRRAHLMSASNFDARRTRWLETSDLRSRDAHADYLQWLIGYGLAVATPEDARVAVAEFERIARPADAFSLNQMLSYYVGHAYLSDGNPTAAKPYLARAVRACSTAQTPLEATWAIVDLAEVHLRTGAPGEACKLLKKTLLRWPSRFDTTRRAARLVEAAHCQSGP